MNLKKKKMTWNFSISIHLSNSRKSSKSKKYLFVDLRLRAFLEKETIYIQVSKKWEKWETNNEIQKAWIFIE